MAILNLSVEIADADLPRLIDAARGAFSNPDLTEKEVVEMLRQYGIQQMQQLVHNHERRMAIAAAENASYSLAVS